MDQSISGDNLTSIALKCPNLKKLEISKAEIDTWPTVCMPSLEELIMVGPNCGSDMFRNMQLHLVLPVLKSLQVILRPGTKMWLPDLTKSLQLNEVILNGGGRFLTQKHQEGTVPFPRSLKKLSIEYLYKAYGLNLEKHKIREYYEHSNCELNI